jgi:UDP-N-acetylglucosamine transferase subunit ALG13
MRTLLVCSGGGHLKQLFTLADRIGIPAEQQFWVTFDNGLSRSLLADRATVFAPYAAPRDALNILRIRLVANMLLARTPFERVISTGSSPAVAFLPPAARKGIPAYYIESAARADGPSMSGRIVARNRGISTFTQYPVWADERWQYRGSIFDAYAPGPARATGTLRRAVVSVGTQEGYGFDRLYRTLVPLLADFDEVLWQTGPQDVSRFGITGRPVVPHDELKNAITEADIVVAHSGTGAALTAIEQGRVPVLVPRLARYREHVDDHQVQIAAELERRGLALHRPADQLTLADLEAAAARSTVRVNAPRFELEPATLELHPAA